MNDATSNVPESAPPSDRLRQLGGTLAGMDEPTGSLEARRTLRYIGAFVAPDDPADLSVAQIASHVHRDVLDDALPFPQVQEALSGTRDHEDSASDLRRLWSALLDGETREDAASRTGLDVGTVSAFTMFAALAGRPTHGRGVSRKAARRIARLARKLSHTDGDQFLRPPTGDADVRRSLRFLGALVAETVPDKDIPTEVLGILGTDNLSIHDVREVVGGYGKAGEKGGETSSAALRQVRLALLAGKTQREAAAETDVPRQIVSQLAQFLGASEASEEARVDRALDHAEQDGATAAFARQEDISRTYATRLMDRARTALDAGPVAAA